MPGVIIVGAGQAGYQTAESLRQEGYDGPITLIGEEPDAPYQRPPLSKAYLLGETDKLRLKFRADDWYAEHGIELRTGTRVTGIDRPGKSVTLHDGASLDYDKLVLVTGAKVRELPVPGTVLDGVCYLKTLAHIDHIEARLPDVERVAVIGGGFIGLEFAAVASKLGKQVTVIEALERVMARVVPPVLSDFYTGLHESHGVEVVCGAMVSEIVGDGGRIKSIKCADGRELAADLAVIGIGIVPDIELAEAAGLTCDNGIVVDAQCRTSDPDIFAGGDCAAYAHPFAGALLRLESVQNAADQGRAIAAAIAGTNKPYVTVPWFWSDQYDVKLQMVGLLAGCDEHLLRGDPAEGRFSVMHYRGDELRSISSVNRPADHIQGRKLLAAGISPSAEQAVDVDFKLKSLLD